MSFIANDNEKNAAKWQKKKKSAFAAVLKKIKEPNTYHFLEDEEIDVKRKLTVEPIFAVSSRLFIVNNFC